MAMGRLPANPKRSSLDDYCSDYAVAHPTTPGGRKVARHGWIVTSETKLGEYDAITFVGALDPSTSATCAHLNGNLAIFDGQTLKALAYEQRPSNGKASDSSLGVDAAAEDSLGIAEQIDPRRIRLHYGLPSAPFADVVLGNGISVEQVAKRDPVCRGAAFVPNVFGKDIRKARNTLMANGWLPQKPVQEDKFAKIIGPGVAEVEDCSGTGYGFCTYNYRHRKGFGLRVVSQGEYYSIMSYEPNCHGK